MPMCVCVYVCVYVRKRAQMHDSSINLLSVSSFSFARFCASEDLFTPFSLYALLCNCPLKSLLILSVSSISVHASSF